MPSFDVVSKLTWSEVKNALNQAQRELAQRFDFKGTGASVERNDSSISIEASTEDRVLAAYQVLTEKLVRRKVSLKHFEAQDPTKGPRGTSRLAVLVSEGISSEKAREIVKLTKASKLKIQASIQEDAVRITGKKRDELQSAIRELKDAELGLELQFVNFRD